MSLSQIRRDIEEIKGCVKVNAPEKSFLDIPLTDEIVRCCHEFIKAQADARKRLIDSGVSEAELKKHENDNYIGDPLVMQAHHNKLRAITNTRTPDREPTKINYLYGPEPGDDLL